MSIPNGERFKSAVWSAVLYGEQVHRLCICFKFVMPNSLNVSGRLTNERIPHIHAMCSAVHPCNVLVSGQKGGGVGGGVDLTLNSLLRAS